MGMYDEVRVKYPLPLPEYQGRTFQTKDLDCRLDQLAIGADGVLRVKHLEREWRDDAESPLGGYLYPVPGTVRWVAKLYTGPLIFYDCLGEGCRGWVSFTAIFTNGLLDRLDVMEHRPAVSLTPEPF